jgi:hypothetical protein
VQQSLTIRGHARRPAISRKLGRIDLDFVNVIADLAVFKSLLRKDLVEPFIIGVGEIRTMEIPNGLLILSGNARQETRLAAHLGFRFPSVGCALGHNSLADP